jgi:nucleoside-diphosphate-sugar epimerase
MSTDNVKPTLVVGATGQVGRQVVAQLLKQNRPVRALVRNPEKAKQVFGDDFGNNVNLQIVVADLGKYQEHSDVLEQAVKGCSCIISVSGALRFSKVTDFLLPWRFWNSNVSSWADISHPYFCNYQAQCLLVDLAKQHAVERFVRLTGGTVGFSAFNPFVILMSGLLSMTTRYHFLTENYIRESNVPYMIIRPGGLMNEDRVSYVYRHWRGPTNLSSITVTHSFVLIFVHHTIYMTVLYYLLRHKGSIHNICTAGCEQ